MFCSVLGLIFVLFSFFSVDLHEIILTPKNILVPIWSKNISGLLEENYLTGLLRRDHTQKRMRQTLSSRFEFDDLFWTIQWRFTISAGSFSSCLHARSGSCSQGSETRKSAVLQVRFHSLPTTSPLITFTQFSLTTVPAQIGKNNILKKKWQI